MRFTKSVIFLLLLLQLSWKGICMSEKLDLKNTHALTPTSKSGGIQFVEQEQLKLTVGPNPVESILQINLKSTVSDEAQILIYNSLGVLIKEIPVAISNGASQFEIQVSNIHPGLYFISVKGKIVNTTGRFIKR